MHLAAVVEGYAIEDQFNADETVVFYRQLLRKSLVFKGESCKSGKFAKERLSIMLYCSATGDELKPLVIGNAARQHYINFLPLQNEAKSVVRVDQWLCK